MKGDGKTEMSHLHSADCLDDLEYSRMVESSKVVGLRRQAFTFVSLVHATQCGTSSRNREASMYGNAILAKVETSDMRRTARFSYLPVLHETCSTADRSRQVYPCKNSQALQSIGRHRHTGPPP